MKKTWTRNDLVEEVSNHVGLPLSESSKIIEQIIDEILFSLEEGSDVKISSFGTFGLRDKTARVGRNPKTGKEADISPRRVLTFRPSHLMKDRIAKGNKS